MYCSDPDKFIDFIAVFKGKELNCLENIISMDDGKEILKLVLNLKETPKATSGQENEEVQEECQECQESEECHESNESQDNQNNPENHREEDNQESEPRKSNKDQVKHASVKNSFVIAAVRCIPETWHNCKTIFEKTE